MSRFGWVLVSLAAVGCEAQKGPAPGASATSGPATNAAPEPTQNEPPPPAPADLDVAAQLKALKCPAKPKPGACAVLEAMKDCKKLGLEMPNGDGRWLGWGYTMSQGKEEKAPFIVKVKRVNQQDVGPGQLNWKMVVEEISKPMGLPFDHAEKAIAAYERGDVPPKASMAVDYAVKSTANPDVFLTRTTGGHVYGLAHGGLCACEHKQRIYVARRAATRTGAGDGLYVEAHAVGW
jgi:hypothetical protein